MKKIIIAVFLILSTLSFSQRVRFKIIPEKTEVDYIGAITLYTEIINKSNKNITILKPSTQYNQKWMYYDVQNDCADIPAWESEYAEPVSYNETDLLIIPPNSKVEITINGRFNANMLSCKSESFQIKLFYDANNLIKDPSIRNCNAEEIKILKMLTPVKIESKKVKINFMLKTSNF